MIQILIVDDDKQKTARIEGVASAFLEGSEFGVTTASTTTEASQHLRRNQYDLLVLDLNIPVREGESPRSDGGMRLLRDLRRKKEWKRPTHIWGLTAFDDLSTSFQSEFSDELWHIVHYDPATDVWEERLGSKLVHIVDTHNSRKGDYRCDLAIVTALHAIELESVLNLPGNWQKKEVDGDASIYHLGKFEREAESISVVAAAATEMGMPAAAVLTMKIIDNFRPRYVAMTGIAAGVKGNFGDILIADQSWDYGSGKSKFTKKSGSMFEPAPQAIPLSAVLKAKLSHFLMSKQTLKRIRDGWTQTEVHADLTARMGPIASGAAVLESKPIIEGIVAHNRKVIGVEMETYGVFVAVRSSKQPQPDVMSIKSICDFGDAKKNDAYQAYAAYTSAAFVYEFALNSLCRK